MWFDFVEIFEYKVRSFHFQLCFCGSAAVFKCDYSCGGWIGKIKQTSCYDCIMYGYYLLLTNFWDMTYTSIYYIVYILYTFLRLFIKHSVRQCTLGCVIFIQFWKSTRSFVLPMKILDESTKDVLLAIGTITRTINTRFFNKSWKTTSWNRYKNA